MTNVEETKTFIKAEVLKMPGCKISEEEIDAVVEQIAKLKFMQSESSWKAFIKGFISEKTQSL